MTRTRYGTFKSVGNIAIISYPFGYLQSFLVTMSLLPLSLMHEQGLSCLVVAATINPEHPLGDPMRALAFRLGYSGR